MAGFQDLIAWQKAMDLAVEVYRVSLEFPQTKRFGLTAQLRRSVVSIPSNIAEGHGRNSEGEFARFLRIANGSLREAQTQMILANGIGFLAEPASASLLSRTDEVARLLNGLSQFYSH